MPRQKRITTEGLDGLNAGLAVLETFTPNRPQLALGEVSARLGLHKSRVFRILNTLKRRGFVEQSAKGGPYALGLKLVELGNAVGRGRSVLAAAAPLLSKLSQTLRGTVVLRVLDGVEQLTLDCVHSPEVLRTSFPVGARLPATYGSTGKVLLAFRPETETGAILKHGAVAAGTARAITGLQAYRRELERVRLAGYALNLEEAVAGVRSVSAPILDGGGSAVAAIGISFPASALPRTRIREVAQQLCEAAREVSARLGYALPGQSAPELAVASGGLRRRPKAKGQLTARGVAS